MGEVNLLVKRKTAMDVSRGCPLLYTDWAGDVSAQLRQTLLVVCVGASEHQEGRLLQLGARWPLVVVAMVVGVATHLQANQEALTTNAAHCTGGGGLIVKIHSDATALCTHDTREDFLRVAQKDLLAAAA